MPCTAPDQPNPTIGLVLVGLGVVLALDRLGLLDAARLLEYWPIVLVVIGASMIVRAVRGSDSAPRPPMPAVPERGPGERWRDRS